MPMFQIFQFDENGLKHGSNTRKGLQEILDKKLFNHSLDTHQANTVELIRTQNL